MATDTEKKGMLAAVPALVASPIVRKRLLPIAWRFARRHPVVAALGAVGAGVLWWRDQQGPSTV